jgi:hypothetical protein
VPKLFENLRTQGVNGQPSVCTRDIFKQNFERLTDGKLAGLDWNNVFAAGGSVLGTIRIVLLGVFCAFFFSQQCAECGREQRALRRSLT